MAATHTNTISSTFEKAVCLHDWWLIKAENGLNHKVLAVGGFTSKETTRIFSSAPIVKRYDRFTLQTADGITVFTKGCINKTRTRENGLSSKVCNHFLIGFPSNWEDFNHHCEKGSISASQSDDCGNINNDESSGKSSDNNSEDPTVNIVTETSAEVSDPSNIELLKTKDIPKENKADVETPSETLKKSRDCSTDSIFNIGDTSKDLKVLKFPILSGGRSSPYLSSVERVKYLSNRVQAICGSKRKRTNFSDSANQYCVNNTDAPAGKKSCLVKNSITSGGYHFGSAQRIILTSPDDAPRRSANNETTQHDASNVVNPSEVEKPVNCAKSSSAKDATENSEKGNSTNRIPSKVVSSFNKINRDNAPSGSVEVRRSGRLRNVKITGIIE